VHERPPDKNGITAGGKGMDIAIGSRDGELVIPELIVWNWRNNIAHGKEIFTSMNVLRSPQRIEPREMGLQSSAAAIVLRGHREHQCQKEQKQYRVSMFHHIEVTYH
jgi:hypothetical protein